MRGGSGEIIFLGGPSPAGLKVPYLLFYVNGTARVSRGAVKRGRWRCMERHGTTAVLGVKGRWLLDVVGVMVEVVAVT